MTVLPPKIFDAAIDETQGLLKQFLGPAFSEAGAFLADRLRVFRLDQELKLLRKASKLIEAAGYEAKAVNIKILFPLLEAAVLEDSEEMTDRWASLLASAADPSNHLSLEITFINVLKQLPPSHAFILSVFYEQIEQHKIPCERWNEEGLIASDLQTMLSPDEKRRIDVLEFNVAVDNLLRLRLIDHPSVVLQKVNGNDVRFLVTSTGILCATHLGKAFVTACNKHPRKGMGYGIPSNSVSNVFQTKGGPLPLQMKFGPSVSPRSPGMIQDP